MAWWVKHLPHLVRPNVLILKTCVKDEWAWQPPSDTDGIPEKVGWLASSVSKLWVWLTDPAAQREVQRAVGKCLRQMLGLHTYAPPPHAHTCAHTCVTVIALCAQFSVNSGSRCLVNNLKLTARWDEMMIVSFWHLKTAFWSAVMKMPSVFHILSAVQLGLLPAVTCLRHWPWDVSLQCFLCPLSGIHS